MKRFIVNGKIDYEDYEEFIGDFNDINDIEMSIRKFINETSEKGLRTHIYIDSIEILDINEWDYYSFRIYDDYYLDRKSRIEDMIKEIREEIGVII